jgi:predicted nuclease with RNAse H fold
LVIYQSKKKEDADDFLMRLAARYGCRLMAIDAPLSLPGAFFGTSNDYFYRACDRVLGAMSPMFLGGLTARAMRLQALLAAEGVRVVESYPAGVAMRVLQAASTYKTDLAAFQRLLQQALPECSIPPFENWHQADAALAWYSAYRYSHTQHLTFGTEAEGIIVL